ncbi:MAG TPA: UvrD-helicase domain-containing protein, partial [Acetobacteraceae bacterium]|nr:UvrD-helicase domain-containing protein [Acetobacteraceae bacterium]
MSERRLLNPMPAAIGEAQRQASDPGQSVWVRANAGSGKTYVLTARVLRLLQHAVALVLLQHLEVERHPGFMREAVEDRLAEGVDGLDAQAARG